MLALKRKGLIDMHTVLNCREVRKLDPIDSDEVIL